MQAFPLLFSLSVFYSRAERYEAQRIAFLLASLRTGYRVCDVGAFFHAASHVFVYTKTVRKLTWLATLSLVANSIERAAEKS
jgi:hypothetical protein